jgi:hypothetical protein
LRSIEEAVDVALAPELVALDNMKTVMGIKSKFKTRVLTATGTSGAAAPKSRPSTETPTNGTAGDATARARREAAARSRRKKTYPVKKTTMKGMIMPSARMSASGN